MSLIDAMFTIQGERGGRDGLQPPTALLAAEGGLL